MSRVRSSFRDDMHTLMQAVQMTYSAWTGQHGFNDQEASFEEV